MDPVIRKATTRILVATSILSSLFLYASLSAAASPEQWKRAIFANPCAGCHGTDGKSTGEIPALDSMSAEYIESAMLAFKSDKRPGTVMNRIAKGYTDEEIKLMAEYFEMRNKK
jgi:sulfide dehydrogenase cytochrome subunit